MSTTALPPEQKSLEAQGPPQPESSPHFVQFYGLDEAALARNAARYLSEGLSLGEGLLVIATKEHVEGISRELMALGVDTQAAIRDERLIVLDGADTLARFMADGQPDWSRFEAVICPAIERIRTRPGQTGVRAYGELVGVLWTAGEYSAAIRVEEFWNQLRKSTDFRLYCSYPIDLFSQELHPSAVDDVLAAHTHLLPAADNGDVENALKRATSEALEPKVKGLARNGMEAQPLAWWPATSRGTSDLLSFRHTYSDLGATVLARAREHYQNEKRFRALLEHSFDGISLIDEQGNVLYASASTKRILGYEPQELIGRSSLALLHPEDLPKIRMALAEVLAKPHIPVQMQFRARHKNGQYRWIESNSTNLLDEPDLRAIISNYRDISERKAAEDGKQRHADELARSNEEMQAFAYAAAHDLKEPLRTVSACTQLLSRNTSLDDNGRKLAAFVVEGAKRMSTLLDDLLAFAGLSAGIQLDRVELSGALQQAIKNLEELIRESAAKITVSALPSIRGNHSHLVELFQNLIGNAIKYRSNAPSEVDVSAERLGDEWIIRVKDNGIGIAPEYHTHVFGLLKRLHGREVPGTGIGLAICKKIVEIMGGRIWVESEPGRGATFCFTATE
jgi:PAS domain S-box-containing protein